MSLCLNGRSEDQKDVSLLAIDQYQREIAWIRLESPLSSEEEASLLSCLSRANGHVGNERVASLAKQACERLVESYQGLVMAMAWKYARAFPSVDVLDFVQEGSMALFLALTTLDHVPPAFLPWAAACIRNGIRRYLQSVHSFVRLPADAMHILPHLDQTIHSLYEQKRVTPSTEEIAREMGTSQERVCEWLFWRECSQVGSLQALLFHGQESDEERVQDTRITSLFERGIGERELRGVCSLMKWVLSPYQYRVVCLYYGLDGEDAVPLSTREVAEQLRTQPCVIRKTLLKVFSYLREALVLTTVDGFIQYALRVEYDETLYYTTRQVMERLVLSKFTVLKYAREGILPAERRKKGKDFVWMFLRQAVDEMVMVKGGIVDRFEEVDQEGAA